CTMSLCIYTFYFFFQAEDGIRDRNVTGVQTVLFRSSLQLQRCHKVILCCLMSAQFQTFQGHRQSVRYQILFHDLYEKSLIHEGYTELMKMLGEHGLQPYLVQHCAEYCLCYKDQQAHKYNANSVLHEHMLNRSQSLSVVDQSQTLYPIHY